MKYDKAGTYEIEYTATDACGNETTKKRTVTVTEPVTYKTVLFDDGTFIINEKSTDRASNIQAHGAVTNEYAPLDEDNNYDFTSAGNRLWNGKIQSIKNVKFGSTVKPTSIAYWFQSDANLKSIDDWTNFDGSEVTTARAFCASSGVTTIGFPPMPKLTTIRYICNQCANLESVVFGATNATNMTDTTDAFQGCYALKTADLTGLAGTIQTCDRMFANVANDGKGDMIIKTIYASEGLDFSQATSSGNVFRSCTSLVGGNGTVFDSNYIGKQYARIDKTEQKGYFTDKNTISNKTLYARWIRTQGGVLLLFVDEGMGEEYTKQDLALTVLDGTGKEYEFSARGVIQKLDIIDKDVMIRSLDFEWVSDQFHLPNNNVDKIEITLKKQ